MLAKLELRSSRCVSLASAAREAAKDFAGGGIETPNLDARLLAAHACNLTSEAFIMERDRMMTEGERRKFDDFRGRRLSGEPVSRIVGQKEFWGLPFSVSPAVLDPRPETELLVEIVLAHVKRAGSKNKALQILDLGVGSGCILAALLTELPASRGFGVDMSLDAGKQARRNFRTLGLRHRAAVLIGNWMAAFATESFDVIVSNPPYIPASDIRNLRDEVRIFDPEAALNGGVDGLDAYRSMALQLKQSLRSGAIAVFETGYDQADIVAQLMSERGLKTSVHMDLAGQKRAVAVERHL